MSGRNGGQFSLTPLSKMSYGPASLAAAPARLRLSVDATVKRYHYDSHDQLRAHLALFVDAHNHARRLKTLRGLTPYEFVCQTWTREPERFRLDPSHHIPGPYT